jgi:hypothetical protein
MVVNYSHYSLDADHPCHSSMTGRQDYCTPTAYGIDRSSIFRNRGDGSFEDKTVETGLAAHFGPGLGIVTSDFDGDGWTDMLVANDGQPNLLWRNDAGQRFIEEAMPRGIAVNRQGIAEANMGVVAVDLDEDCDEDVFITHYRDQMNTLWFNDGQGRFEDRTPETGLGLVSFPFNAFGIGDLDYDNDGRIDLFVANGEVTHIAAQLAAGSPHPLEQRDLLFQNLGGGRFEDVSQAGGASFDRPAVGRGTAVGDVDNDGDADLLVMHNQGAVRLLINQVGQNARWLGIQLVDREGQLDPIGARLRFELADGTAHCRRAKRDGSYASAHDPRVLLGLAGRAEPKYVDVVWPDGERERFKGLEEDRYQNIRQGTGEQTP